MTTFFYLWNKRNYNLQKVKITKKLLDDLWADPAHLKSGPQGWDHVQP
jgi:hypothetical protein